MALKDLIGTTVDGYRLDALIDSTVDEWRFVAESTLSAAAVHIRMPRTTKPDICDALAERYRAELNGSQILQSTGTVVAVRDLIQIDGRWALVTDTPPGESLADMFVQSTAAQPLADVFPWFRTLVVAFESAHRDGIAHGSLGPSDIFRDDDGRISVRGFALTHDDKNRARAQRADVRSLAGILYQATTGKAPKAGFPHAGEATPASQVIPEYPESLSRFISLRLSGDDNDPVKNAGIFRRSFDAMSEYAEIRRKAELSSAARAPEIVFEANQRSLRNLIGPLLSVGVAAFAGAFAAWLYLDNSSAMHIESAPSALQESTHQPKKHSNTSAIEARVTPKTHITDNRLATWQCIHQEFATGGDGTLSAKDLMSCVRAAPGLTIDELQLEAMRIVATLEEKPTATDSKRTQAESFKRLFLLGPDELDQYVTYRIKRRLSLTELNTWVVRYGGKGVLASLRPLALRKSEAGRWARDLLTKVPELVKQMHTTGDKS